MTLNYKRSQILYRVQFYIGDGATSRVFSRAMTILFTYHINKWRNRTVCQMIEERARLHPDKVLIHFESDAWTYDRVSFHVRLTLHCTGRYECRNWFCLALQANRYANQIANYFAAKGYRKGDIVGVVMENCPETICVWLGLCKVRCHCGWCNLFIHSLPKRDSFITYGENVSRLEWSVPL